MNHEDFTMETTNEKPWRGRDSGNRVSQSVHLRIKYSDLSAIQAAAAKENKPVLAYIREAAVEKAKNKTLESLMSAEQQIEFIKELGGVSAVAEICGITRGAVSQWQKNGIPKAQMNFLKAKFPVQYKQISDDINPNQGAEK